MSAMCLKPSCSRSERSPTARFDGGDLTGMNQPPGNFGAKRGHRALKIGLWNRGFQRGVQEKVKRSLFRTVTDYGIQIVV